MDSVEKLHILPGHKCNLSCSHCASNSGPGKLTALDNTEVENIISTINAEPVNELLFTGGEPTLYIPKINRILDAVENLKKMKVMITTNGTFAKNTSKISNVLKRFIKISHIQLSYDLFHGNTLTIDEVRGLEKYCLDEGIEFNVSVCVSNVKQLLQIEPLSGALKSKIIFQKVESSGEASISRNQFEYEFFDTSLLNRTCPNLDMISYLPEKGFTHCCSNLAFNGKKTRLEISNKKLEDYKNSEFYSDIKNHSFGELLDKYNIEKSALDGSHSSPCRLCEKIFSCGAS